MKKLTYILILMIFTGSYAQNTTNDGMKTVEVSKKNVVKNGDEYENKVKVITEKKQTVMTDPDDQYNLNADRIIPPTKVVKTIMVDNDRDDNYDSETKLEYYIYEDRQYGFESKDDGYIISQYDENANTLLGTAIKTSIDSLYFLKLEDFSGIGYFDDDGNLQIEYFDEVTNKLRRSTFKRSSF